MSLSLAVVIGHVLAGTSGARRCSLPYGVSLDEAVALVGAANRVRPEVVPSFAILMTKEQGVAGVLIAGPHEAAKYREGDRLLVVHGAHSDLASNTNTYLEVMTSSWPDQQEGFVNLGRVSSEVVRNLVGQPDADSVRQLNWILSVLLESYKTLGSGIRSWNALWWEHVSASLGRLESVLAEAPKRADIPTYLGIHMPACFGLPGTDHALSVEKAARQLVGALTDYWSDTDSAGAALSAIEARAPGHPLSLIDVSGLTDSVAVSGSVLAGWSGLVDSSVGVAALSETKWSELVSPFGSASARLEVLAGEEHCALDGVHADVNYVMTEMNDSVVRSELVTIPIPLIAPPDRAFDGSRVTLRPSIRAIRFVGEISEWSAQPVLRGRFECDSKMFKPRSFTCALQVPVGDPLSGLIDAKAHCRVILADPDNPTTFVTALLRGGKTARSTQVQVVSPDVPYRDVEWPGEGPHRVVVVDPSEAGLPHINGASLQEWPGRHNLYFGDAAAGPASLTIGSQSIDFLPRRGGTAERFHPLLALIDGVGTCDGLAPPDALSDVRGAIELDLADRLIAEDRAELARCLGHYILPSGSCRDPGKYVAAQDGWRLTARALGTSDLSDGLLPAVDAAFAESAEARAFREAFRDLGISERLRSQAETGRDWISRIDWADLWESPALTRYLETYGALVAAAKRTGASGNVFWASYPFAASVWSLGGVSKLECVLISPAHPLRLAWLAGVSAGLHEVVDPASRKRFAGLIEGWNLPYFGPAENEEGRLVAVPSDAGVEQLFVGWSMLLRAPNQLDTLRVPSMIAGLRAPGSSLSGLNGGAVAKAMDDYRRINPHVSTLSVDLAAGSPTARMEEIDRAVIDAVSSWSSTNDDPLYGGVRVWDSVNRSGELPTDRVVDGLAGTGRPLTWARYQDGTSPDANLRIVQDAGHAMQVVAGGDQRLGALGTHPYRRHEVSVPAQESAMVRSFPALDGRTGWPPFVRALNELESSGVEDGTLAIKSVISHALLFGSKADWTVTGDSMLNPSALSKHLSGTDTQRALWEWQPPFLAGAGPGGALLERRPYVSVVRIPQAFSSRIAAMMTKSWGEDHGVSATVVLQELGARGIGLAALMAMGGTQAIGALGFFVALRLVDAARSDPGRERLVLPIDACDQYLTALSSAKHTLGDQRRADLLLIEISADGVVLLPMEIKYYNLGHESTTLPQVGASSLGEPLAQLRSTQNVLEGLSEAPDASLWNAAFAALVEVGMRLNPAAIHDAKRASGLLGQIANGQLPIRVGAPILTYFTHGAGDYRMSRCEGGDFPHAELVADASIVARSLFGVNEDGLLAEWSDLIDWALSPNLEDGILEVRSATGQPQTAKSEEQGPDLPPSRGASEQLGQQRVDSASSPILDRSSTASAAVPGADLSGVSPSTEQGVATEGGVKFPVGEFVDSIGGLEAIFWPANTALTQLNMGVVGNLGTGKTQLLKAMVANIRRTAPRAQGVPVSMLILDYKGDFVGPDFVEAVGGRVLRPNKLPLNYFELNEPYTPMAAVRKAGSFNEVLSQIFNIGPKQQNTLRRVILELFARHGTAPTMTEVLNAYKEHAEYDSVVGVLEGWVLGEVFADRADGLSTLDELLKDRVVVLSLLDFGSDQNSKNALVAMFLNLYYEYMARLPKWPYEGTDPQLRKLNSFLLVDEATNIMAYSFDALNSLMLQGREFGVGVILSSQYLSHFKSSKVDYAQALRTWFIHSVPNVTMSQLQALGLPGATEVVAKRIVKLPTHHALYSSLGSDGRFIRGRPFYEVASSLGDQGAES